MSDADALPVRTPANSFTMTCSVLIIFSSASSKISSDHIMQQANNESPAGRMKIQPSVIMWRNLILPPKVAPAEMSERRVYAAAARFVTLLPPEGGVPGQRQIAP